MSGRSLLVDVLAVLGVAALVVLRCHDLALMSVAVPAVVLLRFALVVGLERGRGRALALDLALFVLGGVLASLNDHRSVDRFGVYDYLVPTDLGAWSSIPAWMYLYWALIVRALARLVTFPAGAWRPAPASGLVLGLVLVLVTRQTIVRSFLDPWWSWLPFLAAIGVYLAGRRPALRTIAVVGGVALLGSAVEALFIGVGGLHRYALGWLFGVPLWIALWWALALFVLGDLVTAAERWGLGAPGAEPRPTPAGALPAR